MKKIGEFIAENIGLIIIIAVVVFLCSCTLLPVLIGFGRVLWQWALAETITF